MVLSLLIAIEWWWAKLWWAVLESEELHKVPNRLGSNMLCLSNSSLSNTAHHSFAHHHPMAINNESTIFQSDNDMHDNDDNSTSKVVDNDSNCLCSTSDSNEASSFLKYTSTHEDSKVFFNGLSWMDMSLTTIHPMTRLGVYLIAQMTSLSLLNSRYHHHAIWTWGMNPILSWNELWLNLCPFSPLKKTLNLHVY